MYLKEITLDLLYNHNNDIINEISKENELTQQEAIAFDYDRNFKWIRRKFSLDTRCITSMYSRLLGKIVTNDCAKIVFECKKNISDNRIIKTSGVYTTQIFFDYYKFNSSDSDEKKKLTLTALMAGIQKISHDTGWKMKQFDEIKQRIIDLGFLNEWIWSQKWNKTKKYLVQVKCIHNVEDIKIYFQIKDKIGNLIDEKLVITELPDEWAYAKHLRKLSWISDNEISLINCNDVKVESYKF